MAIQRFEPYREMISLRDAMNSLFQESFVRPFGDQADGASAMLPLDISENENEYVVRASLPGVRPDDVQITSHGDTLTIRGEVKEDQEKKGEHWHLRERRFGSFQRTMRLPSSIDANKAQAHFDQGVLTLTLPKAEESKPKQIRVGSSAAGGQEPLHQKSPSGEAKQQQQPQQAGRKS